MRKLFIACLAALLGSCSHHDKFYLWDAGYSISHAEQVGHFAVEVHLNQFKYLGGEVDSPKFRHFVFDRLARHEGCEGGWEMLPCVADRSCVEQTSLSVIVWARCTRA